MMYPWANISAKRILAVLETEGSVQNHPEEQEPSSEHSLVFDHVDFAYPDGEEAVLKDISFTARAGETVAFIGSTGSGKSTLIHLIPRFYDVSAGQIRLDGQDISRMDLAVLRDKIGFVPQKANLFPEPLPTISASGNRALPWRKSSTRQKLPRPMILL